LNPISSSLAFTSSKMGGIQRAGSETVAVTPLRDGDLLGVDLVVVFFEGVRRGRLLAMVSSVFSSVIGEMANSGSETDALTLLREGERLGVVLTVVEVAIFLRGAVRVVGLEVSTSINCSVEA